MRTETVDSLSNLSDKDVSLLYGLATRRAGSFAVSRSIKSKTLNREWMVDAECRGIENPDIFNSNNAKDIKEAKSYCAKCPVIDKCDEYVFALDPHTYGVWAGKTQSERSGDKRSYR